MGSLGRRFNWVLRPQMFVGFVVICLGIAAFGSVSRYSHAMSVSTASGPRVKDWSVDAPQPSCLQKPCLALTFDDGPEPTVTPRVLDILDADNIKATFFVVGRRVPGQEPLLRRMHQEGHEIGNHSWDHAELTRLSPSAVDFELTATQNVVSAAQVPAPRLFRPPYGAVNDMVRSHAGMTIVRWNIDPNDWENHDPNLITESLVAHAKPGGIILLHDIYPATADALAMTIARLKDQYQFVTVSQLMHLSPGDQGQFFGYR